MHIPQIVFNLFLEIKDFETWISAGSVSKQVICGRVWLFSDTSGYNATPRQHGQTVHFLTQNRRPGMPKLALASLLLFVCYNVGLTPQQHIKVDFSHRDWQSATLFWAKSNLVRGKYCLLPLGCKLKNKHSLQCNLVDESHWDGAWSAAGNNIRFVALLTFCLLWADPLLQNLINQNTSPGHPFSNLTISSSPTIYSCYPQCTIASHDAS